ncbi:transglycosylase domain-containing protein [Neoroseomonas soli]|uniref:PBP1A family penicillin-binding protein n=1 Tax=Neoroseomonas soli TaxID=1081025 RepID=A0A9X9X4S3_9PROT|nr:PBP1A family penicillin-binding protein [Neoroseomonas soli]MBR0674402.1 PBP1A family penicillin-binding protein [Neoroseomonas soli]
MPRAVAPRVRRVPPAAPARPAPPARPRRRLAPRLFRWSVALAVWGMLAGFVALFWFAWDLPRPEEALGATRRPSVTLVAADGALLATSGDLYGETVRLSDLPAHVPAAFIAIEDRRFREHHGLDLLGVARALVANVTAGRIVQGGSTLTQQLAKNLFLTPERNLRRKVQEALLALWLEHRFTKNELLTIYLNRVYLGAGTFGVDAAARLYFGVPARRLTVGQAAVLAGLPKAPSRFNPRVNPSAAVHRAVEVLEAMAETGAIPAAAAMQEAERLRFPPAPSRDAGWFADWVRDGLGDRAPPTADLLLRTTLDTRLQAAAEARLDALLAGPGRAAGVAQGAVVAIEAASGAVLAMVGGRDYRTSPFNRATQARRQPGSAFKPFVYLAALEAGARPEDGVSDAPISLGGWSPGNGNWRTRGEITLEDALAHSVNTAAVRVLQRAGGPRQVAAVAQRLGLPGPFPRDASIALGTAEVTLLDLVVAYAPFANGGQRVAPSGVAEARAEGRPIAWLPPARAPVIARETAEAMRRMMVATVARGTGRAAAMPGLAVAGKTGTTQDNRDAWFIGMAGGTVMGVWLGNDDATPMEGVAGGGLPARLFREILETARGRQG